MNAPFDVIAFGEALVDFLPQKSGARVRDVELWKKCLGGAPANVTVGVARLGGRSAMCGVTGDDELGHFISEALAREGVDVSHLRHTREGKTGIGFISLTAAGERSFLFYRNQAAEFLICLDDVAPDFMSNTKVVHLGTNSLLLPSAREAALTTARSAKDRGQIVSCDPNLRLHLWEDPSVLRALLDQLLACCTLVKLSDEEIEFVTGEKDPVRALAALRERGVALPIVTLGALGALLQVGKAVVAVPAPQVEVVDTTGAGDGFTAGLLFRLTKVVSTRAALEALSAAQLEPMARFACRVAAQVVTRLGAVAGLPRMSQLID